MNIDSDDKNNGNSFEYRLREVSDEEIITILKYREHYQPHAVKAAIREALKRGIIESVDELNSERFQSQEPSPRSIFPLSPYENQNMAIFKSLCRIFYGVGIIPVLFGIVQLTRHVNAGAIGALLTGIIFIFVAYRLERTQKVVFANFILAFNLPASGFAFYYLSSKGASSTMDLVAIIIVLVVLLYISLYAYKLVKYFQHDKQMDQ
ncbi:MAG: hypothetical protein JXR22_10325 [Prolixibacteraceae bacterium]|nr:hypothetical protein [Prolixibacteraceae bacterium]